jgi:hypothetical protein
MLANL